MLRVMIAGAGLAGRWHGHAAKKAGARITAVVDADRKRASLLARQHKGAQAFECIADAMQEAPFDVAHICVPTPAHLPLALECLASGAHILVEKPLGVDCRETEKILKAAEQTGKIACPVHQFIFQKGVREIRKRLPGAGRPVYIEAVIHSAGAEGNEPAAEEIAVDILPHPLSLMQELLPSGLPRDGWSVGRSARGELTCWNNSLETGLFIRISMNARPTMNYLTVAGIKGTYHADLFHGFSYFQSGAVSRARKVAQPLDQSVRRFGSAAINLVDRALHQEPAYPGLTRLISEFYKAIESGSPAPLSAEHTLSVARVRDRISDFRF